MHVMHRSYNWKPEQSGAGPAPFSPVEMQQLQAWLMGMENLCGVLGYHTGGECILRPPSSGGRAALPAEDDALFQQLAQRGADLLGVAYMTPQEMGPVSHDYHGHSLDWLYKARGILGVEVELGHCWNDAGLTNDMWLAWDTKADQGEMIKAKWTRKVLSDWDSRRCRAAAGAADATPAEPTLCSSWEPFLHPQLGEVEIGGLHWTPFDGPLLANLPARLMKCFEFTLQHAAMHPCLAIEQVTLDKIEKPSFATAAQLWRVSCRVTNTGPVSTALTEHGLGTLPPSIIRPVVVRLNTSSDTSSAVIATHSAEGSQRAGGETGSL